MRQPGRLLMCLFPCVLARTAVGLRRRDVPDLVPPAQSSGSVLLTGKRAVRSVCLGMLESSGYRSCKCGAVYDRSEHIVEAREISSFECAVCGATIENWNSAWVPRYRFIACPARDGAVVGAVAWTMGADSSPTPAYQRVVRTR